MHQLTVSVVVPCYNGERFVGEAIESALAQTHAPAEVIVADDESADRSVRVASSFGPRVRVIRCAHGGVSAARNAGIAAASSDLIASLDADDVWERDKLEHQLPRFADPSVGLVYGQRVRFGGQSKVDVPWPVALPEGDVFERLYFWCFVPCSSVVFRRRPFLELGGFDTQLSITADFDAWLRLAVSWKFAAVGRVVCRYRRHDDQMTILRAPVVRHMLRVQKKHASELERRTGVSPVGRRHRLAQTYLKELTRMLNRRQLTEAKALVAVLDEEFECDTANIRQAIARKRRIAALPKSAFWLRDLVHRSTGL